MVDTKSRLRKFTATVSEAAEAASGALRQRDQTDGAAAAEQRTVQPGSAATSRVRVRRVTTRVTTSTRAGVTTARTRLTKESRASGANRAGAATKKGATTAGRVTVRGAKLTADAIASRHLTELEQLIQQITLVLTAQDAVIDALAARIHALETLVSSDGG